MYQIKNIKDLDKLLETSENHSLECFVALNGGARSSKDVYKENNIYYVYNYVDDTENSFTEEELFDSSKTIIGDAITSGNFYVY